MNPVHCHNCGEVSWNEEKCENCGKDFFVKADPLPIGAVPDELPESARIGGDDEDFELRVEDEPAVLPVLPSGPAGKPNPLSDFQFCGDERSQDDDEELAGEGGFPPCFPKRSACALSALVKKKQLPKPLAVEELPLAEGEHEEQFFSGGVVSDELLNIQHAQRVESERLLKKMDELRAERAAFEDEKFELSRREQKAGEELQASVRLCWELQQRSGIELKQSRAVNQELANRLHEALRRVDELEEHLDGFRKVREAAGEKARSVDGQRRESEQQFEKLKAELRAECQRKIIVIEKEADKRSEAAEKAFHRYEEMRRVLHQRAKELKKLYKTKLAAELAKRQIPAAAVLPFPLADALLNTQMAAKIVPPTERIPQPPPLPAADPVKSDDEKIPTWQIAVGTGAIGCIIFFAFKLFIM